MHSIFQTFFFSEDWVIIFSLVCFFAFTGTFLVWVTHHSACKVFINSFNGVNPAITAPVAVMFAFSAGFMGSAIWGSFSANTESIKAERQAVFSYLAVVNNEPSFANQGLQPILKEYLHSALDDEWPLLYTEQISPKTTTIFSKLYSKSFEVASNAKVPMMGASLAKATESLYQARLNRIGFRWRSVDSLRWVIIFSIALLLQITVSVVHFPVDKRPAGLSMTIISTFILIIVIALALSVDQFKGMARVSNVPLLFALDALK